MLQNKDTMNTNCTKWLNTRILVHYMVTRISVHYMVTIILVHYVVTRVFVHYMGIIILAPQPTHIIEKDCHTLPSCPWKGFGLPLLFWEKDFGPLLFLEQDFSPRISIFLEIDLGSHPTST